MKVKRKCIIEFTDASRDDFKNLPKNLRNDCLNTLHKLEDDIELGKILHNQSGRNLATCRKLYFANATYRIVYRECENKRTILEIGVIEKPIAEIIAIGRREGMEVYELSASRLDDSAMASEDDDIEEE